MATRLLPRVLLFAPVCLCVLSLGAASAGPLVEAVKNADRAAVRALLQQGVDVNAAEVDGTTALHWAAYRNDAETADDLLRAGANPKAADRYGVTAMHLACSNGNAAIIQRLLTAGVDPNSALPEGETALMTAARSGSLESVKLLLARGADVNARESWRGQSALMWAAAEGHSAVATALIAAGADVHARSKGAPGAGRPQVNEAAQAAEQVAARPSLAPAGAVPPRPDAAPTAVAAVPRSSEPAAAPPAARPARAAATILNFTPLLFAIRAGQMGTVRVLLDAGANVNDKVSDGTSAIVLAILNAHYELAATLAAKGADPNADDQGWTALHQLMWTRRPNFGRPPPPPVPTGNMDSLDLARTLLKHGANPNARQKREPRDNNRNAMNRIGATPFLLAAKAADVAMMKILLESGADPKLMTVEGITPLLAAAGVGIYKVGESPGSGEEALEAVKLLRDLGLDVNAVDENGDTPMHGAAFKGTRRSCSTCSIKAPGSTRRTRRG